MKSAIIFGSGGHARVISAIIHNSYGNISFVGLKADGKNTMAEETFFGSIEQFRQSDIFIGIGANNIRKAVYEKLRQHGITPANCIAANAFVAHDAQLGNGVVVCPGSVIGSGARLGNNTIVNTLSSIDHDCVLGDHSQVTAGVNFGGTTITGENCFFGIHSGTVPNVNIGNNSIVMAGSMVYKDVPENVMVGGNPARIIKSLLEGAE
jgi:sugar O-acyltransferase (sialic acid O-acetyltransferase NeuD family)